MTESTQSKIEHWIQKSGIEVVTGVHIKESQSTGLGLEYDNSENIRDKEEYLKLHAESNESVHPQDETHEDEKSEIKVIEPARSSVGQIQANDDDWSSDGEYNEELSDADSYEGEDASEFDDEYDESDYEEEKILVLIPAQLILSADRVRELARDNNVLASWLDTEDMTEKDVLHIGLLYLWLMEPQNPWEGYFEYLPKQVNLPFNYSKQKLESKCFSRLSLYHTAITKQSEIFMKYQKFVHRKLTESMPTFEEWLLPHSWIASRSITEPSSGKVCLVPVIDLCNHSSKRSNCRYDADDEGNLQLLLTEPADNTECRELFLNYGFRSTTEFFFNYGFIPQDHDNNDFDEIFRVFNPSDPDIRRVLGAGVPDSFYEDSLEFFRSSESQQVLRIIRFPKMVEPDETKRLRFHNDFVMALANEDLINREDSENGAWYLNNQKLVPNNVFNAARELKNESIILKARELVARLCDYFESKLDLDSAQEDPDFFSLAKSEASLYHSYSLSSRKIIAESR